MKKINFLKKLKKEKKIELVEPSEEIKLSYIKKSDDCLKSSRILYENELYENSTSDAYYCMYNILLSLLFKVGIKSENHSASIILFDKLFNKEDLVDLISYAKEERIDKQYYVKAEQVSKATKDSCKDMISKAEDFSLKLKVVLSEINKDKLDSIRISFEDLFK